MQRQQIQDRRAWEEWRQVAQMSRPAEIARSPGPDLPASPGSAEESVAASGITSTPVAATVARVSLTLPGGDRYEGGLRDGLFEGEGDLHFANGNRYIGTFRLGRKQGNGTFIFANGDKYVGEFVQNQRHGHGVYTYRDGSRYEGEFRSGLRNGKGRYTYKTGGEYIGEFKDGKKTGRGTHLFADGNTLDGYWREDRFISATSPGGHPPKGNQ